jgi:transposase InsO family protein
MHIHFDLNAPVLIDNVYGTVVQARDTFTKFKMEDGSLLTLRPSDVLTKIARHEMQSTERRLSPSTEALSAGPVRHFLALPPAEAKKRTKRRAILDQLRHDEGEAPYSDEQLANFALRVKKTWNTKLALSRTTLRDWLALEIAGMLEGAGNEAPKRLETEVEDLIQLALDEHFRTPAPLSGDIIFKGIRTEINRRNREIKARCGSDAVILQVPSPATIYRRMDDQDDEKRIAEQLGERQAHMMYGAFGAAEVELLPMRVIEIDHTRVDLEIVDEDGHNLGRPWLTIAIDRATRMIVAWHLGWTPPSTLSVMLTLRHMLLDRGYIRETFGDFIKGDLVRCGLPSTIVVDNGKEFHSDALAETCRELNITLKFAEAYAPQKKGKIERFHRTLNTNLVHLLPGTTFSSFNRNSDYKPRDSASVTLHQFSIILHKYLIDRYPHQWHRGLKNTPYAAWSKPKVRFAPREPRSPEELHILTCPMAERTVQRYGIELHGLRYQHDALSELRIDAKGNPKVVVRFDPTDMTMIGVIDKAGRRIIQAVCTDPEFHGLTLWQVLARKRSDLVREASLRGTDFFAEEAEWLDMLGVTQVLRPGARRKGGPKLARALTLAATPQELHRQAPLALNNTSTFTSIATVSPVSNLLADYGHIADLPPMTGPEDNDEAYSIDVTDLDVLAAKYNLNH